MQKASPPVKTTAQSKAAPQQGHLSLTLSIKISESQTMTQNRCVRQKAPSALVAWVITRRVLYVAIPLQLHTHPRGGRIKPESVWRGLQARHRLPPSPRPSHRHTWQGLTPGSVVPLRRRPSLSLPHGPCGCHALPVSAYSGMHGFRPLYYESNKSKNKKANQTGSCAATPHLAVPPCAEVKRVVGYHPLDGVPRVGVP